MDKLLRSLLCGSSLMAKKVYRPIIAEWTLGYVLTNSIRGQFDSNKEKDKRGLLARHTLKR